MKPRCGNLNRKEKFMTSNQESLEVKVRQMLSKNDLLRIFPEVHFSQKDEDFFVMHDEGVVYRTESWSLLWVKGNEKENIDGLFSFLNWGWLSVEELFLLKKILEQYNFEKK